MANKIQLRRDTPANWSSTNPTLSQGEIGYELNTGKLKIGTGSTPWNSLSYLIIPTNSVTGSLTFPDSSVQTTAWLGSFAFSNLTGKPTTLSGYGITDAYIIPALTGNSGKYLTTDGSVTSWANVPSGALTFAGDVTGTGTTGSSTTLTLANSGVSAGTYNNLTVNAKGIVTSASNQTYATQSYVTTAISNLVGGGSISSVGLSGSFSDLINKPTTISGYGITDGATQTYVDTAVATKQPLDADLTAIAALTGTNGLLKKTAADTWTLDTSTYLTGITSAQVSTALGFTPYSSANPSNYATQTYVTTAITNVIGAAPAALDTLQELSAALGNDANYAATITTALAGKQPLDADLTAIAGLAGTSGFLKKTAADSWILDTSTYLTDINNSQVTTALGFTPYNASNPSGYITGNQNIAISGDITGSGATSITATLATVNSTVGTFGSATAIPVITVNAKGLVTGVTTTAVSIPSGSLSFTGDVSGSGTTGSTTTLTLANSGVTAGTYTAANITVDAKGRITSATSSNAGTSGNTYGRSTTTATAGQTTFSVAYTPGLIQVYVNGVLLNNTEYTATNGTSVVLNSAATAGETVEFIVYGSISTVSAAGISGSFSDLINKPTTLSGYGITDGTTQTYVDTAVATKQPLDADLTAIAALAGTSGFLKKTAADTWTLDTSTYLTGISSSQVTTALGFTPYNASNPSGYLTGITSSQITTALGFTPYNSTNPSGYLTGITSSQVVTALGFTPYNSSNPSNYATQTYVNTAITNVIGSAPAALDTLQELSAALGNDANYAATITTALAGKQPLDADLTAIAAISATSGFLKKTAADTWSLDTSTYLTGINSSQVTTALGFTPYNASNPNNYITGNQSIAISGDITGTGTTSISATLATVNSNTGTFGSATAIPVITVNAKGLVTAVTTNSVSIPSGVLTFIGDVTGSGATGSNTGLTLATVNSNTGTFGSATAIPVITVNAKGLVTAVTTNNVSIPSGSLTFTGDVTGSGTTGSSTALTLANSGVTAGTYSAASITVDAKGRITSASNGSASGNTYTRSSATATAGQTTFSVTYTPGLIQIYVNGVLLNSTDYTATNGTSVVLGTAATAGEIVEFVVFGSSSVISTAGLSGSFSDLINKPTTISGYGITDGATQTYVDTAVATKQALDADLTAIAGLAGTSGFLKKTAADTWTLDTSTYLTGVTSSQITTALGFTPYSNANPSNYATQTYVTTAIANVIGSAPAALDTLQELSAALGNDANYAATITTALSGKQPLDADLTAIAGLTGTSGFLKKTAADTWSLDTSTYLTGINSSQVTTALGFTPYNASNPSGYISGITSSQVTIALGFTPYSNANPNGYISGNQSISITGDITGTGTTGITATLATVNSNIGTFGNSTAIPVITVNAKGLVTAVTTNNISIPSGSLTFTGDVTGSGTTGSSTALTLANSGVTAGTYTAANITVDAKGRITSASSTSAASGNTYTRSSATATAGQTTFSVTYTPGLIQVYVNGVLLNSNDYTATNGTSVTLSSAATAGEIVEFIVHGTSTAVSTVGLTGNFSDLTNKPTTLSGYGITDGGGTVTAISNQQNTSTGALGLPKGTTAQRPATPYDGYTRINTDLVVVEIYYNSTWFTITSLKTVPGAPTIGTATQTGSTTATVAFTAPTNNGGATIISYTAVSSPGGITGTLNQAGSGTITVSGLTGSTAYTFTVYATNSLGNSTASSASNSITTAASTPTSVEYLVVAGGGAGGGDYGGGGGAGGMLTSSYTVAASTAYTITVGGGGSNSTFGTGGVIYTAGSSGTITAYRGGTGASYSNGGNSGGSGGGASGGSNNSGAPGGSADYSGQGYAGGGRSTAASPGAGDQFASGGGGGAGGVGGTGVSAASGDGGAGLPSSITGTATYYAGGGGGGGRSVAGISAGAGGSGIGGAGNANYAGGFAASANTGSGGGGAGSGGNYGGGTGGSGIVIIAYPNTYNAPTSISGGLSYDQPTRSGYRVYRFTGGTGTISW